MESWKMEQSREGYVTASFERHRVDFGVVVREQRERPQWRKRQRWGHRRWRVGGCASYRFDFAPGASSLLIPAVDPTVALVPRAVLVKCVRDQEGLALCGRGASCPG